MCSNGVEWKTLGEVAKLERGVVISKEYLRDNAGVYPVYSSQTENNGEFGRINTYRYDGTYVTWTTDGAYAGTVFRRYGKFNITNVCGLINILDKDCIDVNYLYYILSITTKKYVNEGMGNPKLMSNVMAKVKIPLPPLAIQSRIVEILDHFTNLTANLTAELALRRKQFEHFREKLLSLDGVPDVEWKTLGKLCEIGTGKSNRQDALDNGNYPFFVRSKDVLSIDSFEFDEEAVIIPGEGGIGDIFHYINGKYALHQRAYRVHPISTKVSGKFLYYYLFANFKKYINSKAVNAIVTSIRKPMLEGFPIPLPPLAVQQSIVEQLDKFTALIQNIENELALRQKQYEYYREKLLSFPSPSL